MTTPLDCDWNLFSNFPNTMMIWKNDGRLLSDELSANRLVKIIGQPSVRFFSVGHLQS